MTAPTVTPPRVTAIICFLNESRFLSEAIESVLAQDCHDWELILIDDGSTDHSTAVARRYADRHSPRIRYLEHDGHANRGLSASRNLGIRSARGDLIAFLDGDDVWLPQKLREQIEIMDQHPEIGLLFGDTEYWYSWDESTGLQDRRLGLAVEPDTVIEPPILLERILSTAVPAPCTCSMMVRSSVAREIGGFEESFRGLYEDQVFLAKVGVHAPVLGTNRVWDRYRQHSSSMYNQSKATGSGAAARIRYLTWLREYARGTAHASRVERRIQRELKAAENAARGSRGVRAVLKRMVAGIGARLEWAKE